MRKILSLLVLATLFSCEEVITVDLDTAPPRLVVDASLDWVNGTDGTQQTIRLTQTAAYYASSVLPATGALVRVENASGQVFEFVETPGTGRYVCNDFLPEIGMEYELFITYEGQEYTARETLLPVPEITSVIQDDSGGFLGDEKEIRIFYQDDPAPGNYYLTRYVTPVLPFPSLSTSSDEFTNGNLNFDIFSDPDLDAGDTVDISLYGISRTYHEYLLKLLTIAGSGPGGGPFTTPPATVRGNVRNLTDPDKFALGFFRVTQAETLTYTVQ